MKNEDYSFVNHDNANKRCRCTLRKQNTFEAENVNFLLKYFQDTKPPTSRAPPQVREILKDINRWHFHYKRSLLRMNQLQGALMNPECNLLMQSDAANIHFSFDHLASAELLVTVLLQSCKLPFGLLMQKHVNNGLNQKEFALNELKKVSTFPNLILLK